MMRLVILLAFAMITTNAFAHGPNKGPNGGRQADAGDYHVEMIAKGTGLTVYLHDEKDKPVDAQGHRAIGIFVVGGKPQRIELNAENANRLSGTSTVPLPGSLKGVVQITLPTGKTVQAKFE